MSISRQTITHYLQKNYFTKEKKTQRVSRLSTQTCTALLLLMLKQLNTRKTTTRYDFDFQSSTFRIVIAHRHHNLLLHIRVRTRHMQFYDHMRACLRASLPRECVVHNDAVAGRKYSVGNLRCTMDARNVFSMLHVQKNTAAEPIATPTRRRRRRR